MIEIEASRFSSTRHRFKALERWDTVIALSDVPHFLMDVPDLEKRQVDETEGRQFLMDVPDLEKRQKDETKGHQFRMDVPDLVKHPEDETEGRQFQMDVLDVEKHQEDETEGPQFRMDIPDLEKRQDDETEGRQFRMGVPDLEKRKKDETEGRQLRMDVPDLEKRPEDDTEGRQFRMDVLDLEKCQEDETNGCSIMASLTTTPEGNKDEKLNIIISLIGLLATAATIAAIPVPENSRKKTLGKICSDLFDILVLIFLGAVIILGIYVQLSKAKGMKHINYFVLFFILVVCSILKMVMVAVGDL